MPAHSFILAVLAAALWPAAAAEFNDSHVHLTNYVQEGPDAKGLLKAMGEGVGRAVLMGIPLQQLWSHRVSGDAAPRYYLDTDAPLYYYSFTDAVVAEAYLALPQKDRERLDPMITGFNPADMYAVDHVRRVLKTFPGVFEGIGEFSIHKEFVTSKAAGEVPSLQDPALDRLLDFAGEAGLIVLLHNDADRPFAKAGDRPVYLAQLTDLFKRHPKTTIIWAHCGLGRVIQPVEGHAAMVSSLIEDPAFADIHFDLSWDEVAKYIVSSERALRVTADLLNRHPDRFLFGTDEVAPTDPEKYRRVFKLYKPLWSRLTPEARKKILLENHERLFNQARTRVRAWEKEHLNEI